MPQFDFYSFFFHSFFVLISFFLFYFLFLKFFLVSFSKLTKLRLKLKNAAVISLLHYTNRFKLLKKIY